MKLSESAEKQSKPSPPKVVILPQNDKVVKVDIYDSNDEISQVEIS